MEEKIRKMSVTDLSMWLDENGIQSTYCEQFEGALAMLYTYYGSCFKPGILSFLENEIDGEAFCELSETDIKAIIKPLGIVKRIIRLQKSIINSVRCHI